MCNFSIGQPVTMTGKLFCKKCNQIMANGGERSATFACHESGFDVFHFDEPITCQWCGTVNEAGEQPCGDPIPAPFIYVENEEPCAKKSSR